MKSAPSNFAKCNALFRNENPQILDQFALLECFWNATLKMFTFEISTREFVKLQSFIQTNKTLNVGQNIALFRHSQDGLCKKIIVLLEINTFKFIKNDFLTNIVNFGIGFPFSNCQRSVFSKGSGLGLDQLYKVCHASLY